MRPRPPRSLTGEGVERRTTRLPIAATQGRNDGCTIECCSVLPLGHVVWTFFLADATTNLGGRWRDKGEAVTPRGRHNWMITNSIRWLVLLNASGGIGGTPGQF
jgi:hypothetical protein